MSGKYRLATLGCKVNQYESQQFRELLESLGLRPAGPHETADLAVVNTCAVTISAGAKSRQAVRRLARDGASVVVIGCGASADAQRLRGIPGVAGVWGHDDDATEKLRNLVIARRWNEAPEQETAPAEPTRIRGASASNRNDEWMMPRETSSGDSHSRQSVTNRGGPRSTSATGGRRDKHQAPPGQDTTQLIVSNQPPFVNADLSLTGAVSGFEDHHRAYLKVQDGCDACCTYCIIPKLRPTPRFKPIEAVVDEAAGLVRAGYREVILTGIFLGAYGRETAIRRRFGADSSPLADLIDAVAQVPGLERLRLSSLEPGDVNDALLDTLAAHENCVPHLHLPLQSGSGDVLRRMNRQYTIDDFTAMVDRVRATLDRPAITTDVIVGFPDETEEDFRATLDAAKHAGFCKIHAFPFSPRPGTAAARWASRYVAPPVVKERMNRLAEVERACSLEYRRGLVGAVEHVLVEHEAEVDGGDDVGEHLYDGRCDRYFRIHFEAIGLRPGEIAPVRIDRVTPTRSHGTHVPVDTGSIALPVLVGA